MSRKRTDSVIDTSVSPAATGVASLTFIWRAKTIGGCGVAPRSACDGAARGGVTHGCLIRDGAAHVGAAHGDAELVGGRQPAAAAPGSLTAYLEVLFL